MTLEERGDKTQYTCHILHKTKEGRDGHIASGMEKGANIALDRLEKLAREIGGGRTSGQEQASCTQPS